MASLKNMPVPAKVLIACLALGVIYRVSNQRASGSLPRASMTRYRRNRPSRREHELPTRDYYYRDRNSGQFVGSDSPNPPDNSHDYEPLQLERWRPGNGEKRCSSNSRRL